MIQCSLCDGDFNLMDENHWELYDAHSEQTSFLCSPSCIVEAAWQIKENQPKLSKSKVDDGK